MIEYIVTLSKEDSNKLTKLSEAAGIDNDLEYLESMIIKMISRELRSAEHKES